VELKDTGKARESWLGYVAEFLTIFFALALLTGRIYAESYWKVFGLSPEFLDSVLVDYAIVSPNTAVASVLMAASTVAITRVFVRRPPNFVGDRNPNAASIIGAFAWVAGVSAISIIPRVNLSTWVDGTAGLAFGLGFLCFNGGLLLWMQGAIKAEKKPQPRWVLAVEQWIRNHIAIESVVVRIIVVIGLAATSFWAMMDTANKFGFYEAVMTYDQRPVAMLLLDSPTGFEDLVSAPNASGSALMKVKIITEAGGFLYVSPGATPTPLQLHVRAVPVSRVQAIQYAIDITPPK